MTGIEHLVTKGRELVGAAAPGPWEAFGTSAGSILDRCNCDGPTEMYEHDQYCGVDGPVAHADAPDIEFIVWARNHVPELLDRLERVRAFVDDPGNWSTLDGRRKLLLDMLDGK